MNSGQHQKPRMQFRKCERTISLTDPYQLAPRRAARFSESHDFQRDSNDAKIRGQVAARRDAACFSKNCDCEREKKRTSPHCDWFSMWNCTYAFIRQAANSNPAFL
jgi:hypothetical protein